MMGEWVGGDEMAKSQVTFMSLGSHSPRCLPYGLNAGL